MPNDIYEVVAQGARYWFLFLMALIVWRSWRWLARDRKQRRKRLKLLPDAGFVGEMVVQTGNAQLPAGLSMPVPREGVLGRVRGADLCVPAGGVAKHHLWFEYDEENGLYIEPYSHHSADADGQPLLGRRTHAYLTHGSRLTVGDAVLRLRMFAGFEQAGVKGANTVAFADEHTAPGAGAPQAWAAWQAAQGLTPEQLAAMQAQGYTPQQLAAMQAQGYTPQQLVAMQAQGMTPQQLAAIQALPYAAAPLTAPQAQAWAAWQATQGLTPQQLAAMQAQGYTSQQLAAMQAQGLTPQQLAAMQKLPYAAAPLTAPQTQAWAAWQTAQGYTPQQLAAMQAGQTPPAQPMPAAPGAKPAPDLLTTAAGAFAAPQRIAVSARPASILHAEDAGAEADAPDESPVAHPLHDILPPLRETEPDSAWPEPDDAWSEPGGAWPEHASTPEAATVTPVGGAAGQSGAFAPRVTFYPPVTDDLVDGAPAHAPWDGAAADGDAERRPYAAFPQRDARIASSGHTHPEPLPQDEPYEYADEDEAPRSLYVEPDEAEKAKRVLWDRYLKGGRR